ncbi:MAG: copper-binding protein [Pseudomonadota bacterium]
MKFNLLVAAAVAVLSGGVAAAPVLAHPGEDHSPAPQTAEGTGVVKGVDARALTVTLSHDPIAALKWPAMTMKFKVESAAVLQGVKVGGKVHFVLRNIGGKPVVTAIHAL